MIFITELYEALQLEFFFKETHKKVTLSFD